MKIKLFAASLTLVLLLGMLAVLPGNAEEQVVLPSWCYDFSTGLIFSNISGNGVNLSIEITERSHTTLTALAGDPQLSLTAPGIYVDSAKYLCIEYRTESAIRLIGPPPMPRKLDIMPSSRPIIMQRTAPCI